MSKSKAKLMQRIHHIKHKAGRLRSSRTFQKGLLFVMIFGAAGGALYVFTRAATPTAHFESEQQTLTTCATVIDDVNASSSKAVAFGCPEVPPPPPTGKVFVHPGVVYTKAQIDAWSTSHPSYTQLASSGAASLSKTPWVYGTQINSGGDARCTNCDLNNGFKDQSGYAKIQAVLWAADNNTARRDKVVAYLNEFRSVTSWEWDSVEQYRLVSGWACTNLAQSAEIVNYQDAGFKNFLRKCYDIMDWPANPNWHASFADSKLAIAAYLGDAALWADAKAYFNERIKQSFYHSTYDTGNKVNPMHTEDNGSATRLHTSPGTPKISATQQHWGRDHDSAGVGQVKTDYTFNTAFGSPVNGMNAERLRDLGHVNMSLGAWMHAARTILAQGEQLEQHAYDRLLTGYGYHGQRVLSYLQTGAVPAPVPKGIDLNDAVQGWYGAKKLFGTATPQSVISLLARSDIQNKTTTSGNSYAGTNHLIAEQFADN